MQINKAIKKLITLESSSGIGHKKDADKCQFKILFCFDIAFMRQFFYLYV
jgi:hypothetical protein